MASQKFIKTRDRALRYPMCDFINAVHARPQLWERQHPDYHNREKRELAWREVAKRLYPKFDAMTNAEKQKTVMLLPKRWKNTRDSFFRAQRRSRSHKDQQDETRAYIYEKEMNFLLHDSSDADTKHAAVRRAANNNSGDGGGDGNDADGQTDDVNNKDDVKIKAELVSGAATRSKRKRRGTSKFGTRSKKRRDTHYAATVAHAAAEDVKKDTAQPSGDSNAADSHELSALLPSLEMSSLKEESNADSKMRLADGQEIDPDQAFFDSIKPVVRDMSTDQKLDFQIAVLRLLKDFRGNN